MSSQYARDHCKIALGKILQTIGWHSINSIPLEVLTDIMGQYINQISKITNEYANEFGQTEPNLDHLGLAFQEMGINVHELEEYVTYVNFAPGPAPVPKFPIPKESNLNFLKPGSKEVVTRPVHIYEHLPPMFSLSDGNETEDTVAIKKEQPEDSDTEHFKKPADVTSPEFKRLKRDEEGSRPTREISSVMMTTSGFLSPAREGKLPEAKAPVPPPEPIRPPTPTALPVSEAAKKKFERKKEKVGKELFKPLPEEKITKKTASPKDTFKSKQMKAAQALANALTNANNPVIVNSQPHLPLPVQNEVKISPVTHLKPNTKHANFTKALAAAKAKTEKLNTTITPIPMQQHPSPNAPHPLPVDKLFSEPDKKKVNIFKKISNVKDKHEKNLKRDTFHPHQHLFHETEDIVSKINLSSDITIEPIMPSIPQHKIRSPERVECLFDDGSPPGTPSTPRTPELVTHSPPVLKEKRKRKDKSKVKKIRKQHIMEADIIDMSMDRPKTPEVRNQLQMPPVNQYPFPFASFGGPGLIPAPLHNPLFPFSQFHNFPNFGENPYFPPVQPNIPPAPMPFVPQKVKQEIKQEPEVVQVPPVVNQPPLQSPQIQHDESSTLSSDSKKGKDHKKEKKDKIKKKNKKDKVKDKEEKKKLKEAKKDKDKVKKEKKEKKKDKEVKEAVTPVIPKMILKVNSPSPRPETPENMKKLNIKPIVKKEEDLSPKERKREPSPGLAKISALVTGPPKKTSSPLPPPDKPPVEAPPPATTSSPRTPGRPRIHPVKQKPAVQKPKKIEQPFVKKDEQGNDIWICPACGQQDDGRPMIGCDGCDAWYHWVCVGIQVPPDENENWYCKPCLCKKDEDLQDKKKKRKKKEKKDH